MAGGKGVSVRFASGAEVRSDCIDWALEIAQDYVPDLIVFLSKSGFLFAEPMAACFGCEMVDLEVSRPSNGSKDVFTHVIPWLPKSMLAIALRSKAMYGYHDHNPRRDLVRTDRYRRIDFAKLGRVLLVDDSIDTGWSMLEAVRAVREDAPECEVKIASYCVIDGSEGRVRADYWRHKNAIVVTATSRYSPEYASFNEGLDRWRAGVC